MDVALLGGLQSVVSNDPAPRGLTCVRVRGLRQSQQGG